MVFDYGGRLLDFKELEELETRIGQERLKIKLNNSGT